MQQSSVVCRLKIPKIRAPRSYNRKTKLSPTFSAGQPDSNDRWSIPFFNFNFVKFVGENIDSQIFALSDKDERCQKKNSVILQIFFTNLVSKTYQETNSFLIKKNNLLANYITTFETRYLHT